MYDQKTKVVGTSLLSWIPPLSPLPPDWMWLYAINNYINYGAVVDWNNSVKSMCGNYYKKKSGTQCILLKFIRVCFWREYINAEIVLRVVT